MRTASCSSEHVRAQCADAWRRLGHACCSVRAGLHHAPGSAAVNAAVDSIQQSTACCAGRRTRNTKAAAAGARARNATHTPACCRPNARGKQRAIYLQTRVFKHPGRARAAGWPRLAHCSTLCRPAVHDAASAAAGPNAGRVPRCASAAAKYPTPANALCCHQGRQQLPSRPVLPAAAMHAAAMHAQLRHAQRQEGQRPRMVRSNRTQTGSAAACLHSPARSRPLAAAAAPKQRRPSPAAGSSRDARGLWRRRRRDHGACRRIAQQVGAAQRRVGPVAVGVDEAQACELIGVRDDVCMTGKWGSVGSGLRSQLHAH